MKHNRVLVITSILPISEIARKKSENDILLETEDRMLRLYEDVSFKYIFLLPYTNRILALLSPKWKSYFSLQRKKSYNLRGRIINILGLILLPKALSFRHLLFKISLFLNKSYIESIIKDFRPTVVHAQSTDSDAYVARKVCEKYGIPYVVTLRGLHSVSDSLTSENLNRAKSLVAVSKIQMQQAKKITNKDVTLIPHGISEMFYNRNTIRRTNKVIRFVTVSRLLKLKNIDLVIKALSELSYEYSYDIYGEGPEREYLCNLIVSLGQESRIRVLGYVSNSNLPSILVGYDLFIMPSFPETLGRVYFEAMASRLPVIATKNTGIDGILSHGDEGFLVDLEDDSSIKSTLELVLSGKVDLLEMGKRAYDLSTKFSWEEVCKKIHSIYNDDN